MMLRSLAARTSRVASVARTPPSAWRRSFSVANRLRAKVSTSVDQSTSNAHQDPVELDSLTTLPNGVRVASENLPGHFSGIGVYLDAGSRYENAYLSGASHIIDRLAFKATTKRSADHVLEAMEMLGGNMHCASSRESLIYQAATFNSAVPDGVALLAETIRDPLITPEEIEQQLETAAYEISEIWAKPELILPELVHVAAYRNNTLGNPLLCPEERLSSINRDVIEAYRKTFYLPERMVVAFAGVEHGEAVRLTEKWFGDMQRATDAQRSAVSSMIGKQPSSQSGMSSGEMLTMLMSQERRTPRTKPRNPPTRNLSSPEYPSSKISPQPRRKPLPCCQTAR
jgi:processing peptidase subunit alpha